MIYSEKKKNRNLNKINRKKCIFEYWEKIFVEIGL